MFEQDRVMTEEERRADSERLKGVLAAMAVGFIFGALLTAIGFLLLAF